MDDRRLCSEVRLGLLGSGDPGCRCSNDRRVRLREQQANRQVFVDPNEAFDEDWGQDDLLWINAPFQKISPVFQKVVKEKAKAILVVPEWETEWWWQRVENIYLHAALQVSEGAHLPQGGQFVARSSEMVSVGLSG